MKKMFITAMIAMTLVGTQVQANSIVKIDKDKIVSSTVIASLGCLAGVAGIVIGAIVGYDTCWVLKLEKKEKGGK